MDIVAGDLPREYVEAALRSTIIGMDIETSGLRVQPGVDDKGNYRKEDTIACVQMYVPEFGAVMVRYLDERPVRLSQLLESLRVTKVFQYGQFDLSFLMRDYPFINPRKICDTKIAADVLDPGNTMFTHPVENKGSHSLISLVWHYYQDLLDKAIAVSDWHNPNLTPEQLAYAEKDVLYLPGLLKKLEREIYNKNPLLIHDLHRRYLDIPNKAIARLKKAA